LAYDYCCIEDEKCKEFSSKLQDLVTADEYFNFTTGSTSINEEEIFIRELVRIIARYKAAGVIITSLNKNVLKLKDEIDTLEQEKTNLENTISGMVRLGQAVSVKQLTPVPDNIEQEGIETVNVDSSGNGLTIRVSGGEVFVDTKGQNYKVNDVVSFNLTLAVDALSKINIGIAQLLHYTDNSQYANSSQNTAVTATYYIKVLDIDTPQAYAQEINLETLLFKVPLWTRMYFNISPDEFDINKLIEIKEAIENYDVQYAILKYGTSDDMFDTRFV